MTVGGEGARPATADDLEVIDALASAQAAAVADARGGDLLVRRESGGSALDRATALLGDPHGLVLVGTYDDVVFGYAIGRVETLDDGALLGRLDDLVVDPEAREVGIGEAMMNLVIDTFRSRGCLGVDSRALPGDRETKNFFETFGLVARAIRVHRRIDPA